MFISYSIRISYSNLFKFNWINWQLYQTLIELIFRVDLNVIIKRSMHKKYIFFQRYMIRKLHLICEKYRIVTNYE